MGWSWEKDHLDFFLVPTGLFLMLGYHGFLLYRCHKHPHKTAIGHDNHYRAAWTERVMQVDFKDRGAATSLIAANISAATSLCTVCIIVSSLIGTWIGTSTEAVFRSNLIYGATSEAVIAIKHILLLTCFLIAFTAFVQTVQFSVNANFLISMPDADVPIGQVQMMVDRGCDFWLVGMRALYFAITLLLWVFGPIPMFVSSVVMVAAMYSLDKNSKPLHQFLPMASPDISVKIGQEMNEVKIDQEMSEIGQEMSEVKIDREMSKVGRGIEHHGRPHGNCCRRLLGKQ